MSRNVEAFRTAEFDTAEEREEYRRDLFREYVEMLLTIRRFRQMQAA